MKSPLILFLFCVGAVVSYAQKRDLMVNIQPVFSGKPLVLSTHTYITKQGDTLSFDRLRFYVSSLVLTMQSGEKYVEPNSFHLIDAEEPATLSLHLKNIPAGRISSLSFNIGVDSATSVSGAMGGDLDPVKGMYWAWNSGYINAKLEGHIKTFNGKKSEPFEFHIGGYMQPYYALRNINVIVNHENNDIVLSPDIAAWFDGWNKQKEKSIMIPGAAAMTVANRYAKMFTTK